MDSIVPYALGLLGVCIAYLYLRRMGAYAGQDWRENARPSVIILVAGSIGFAVSSFAFSLTTGIPQQLQFGLVGTVFGGALWQRYGVAYYAAGIVRRGRLLALTVLAMFLGLLLALGAGGGSTTSNTSTTDDSEDEDDRHFLIRWVAGDDEEDED